MRRSKSNLHNRMRNFRLDADLTQSDIAFLLDIKNVGRISEWENNKAYPGLEHALSLEIILHRLSGQVYDRLRHELSEKIAIRRSLLTEKKQRERRLDKDG